MEKGFLREIIYSKLIYIIKQQRTVVYLLSVGALFLFIITIIWVINESHVEKSMNLDIAEHNRLANIFVNKYSNKNREIELQEYVKEKYERGEISDIVDTVLEYMNSGGALYLYSNLTHYPDTVRQINSWENVADGSILDGAFSAIKINAIAAMLLNTEGIITVSMAKNMSSIGKCSNDQLSKWIRSPPWETF